jgi:hypothetical protein
MNQYDREQRWKDFVENVDLANGTITLINFAGGDPTLEIRMKVFDSYRHNVRELTETRRFPLHLIDLERPDDLRHCPVVRQVHQFARDMFIHECDEQFLFDGEHIFDPHREETRLPGVIW